MHPPFNACDWLVDRHVREGGGDREAVRCQGRSWTYADLLGEIEAAATGLRRLGVRPEERIGMVMLDSVEFVAVFLGALRIGAVPVPSNPLLPGRDLGVITADSRARVVVVSGARAESVPDLLAAAPEVRTVVLTDGAQGTGFDHVPWTRFTAGTDDAAIHDTWAESPGFWLCTSGTTGLPKLAMHRHGDLQVTYDTYARQVLDVAPDDVFFSVGPMFHAYGLGNSLTFPLAVGATVVLEPTRPPTPDLVADIVRAERPTLFFCIPTFYLALNAAELAADTFESVRYGVSAAEPLPAETFHRFHAWYGVEILDGFGSTEMLHIVLTNSPDFLQPGTSGRAVPGYEIRVVDEDGAETDDDVPGEMIVRGESAAVGYWCRSDTSRSTFVGEWTHTGDLYVRSPEGAHTYLGRADDMMKVGGEWVSPAEVEAVLIQHADVLEAAVVGERSDDSRLRPMAYVIPAHEAAPDPDELIGFCRDRLAGFKRPARIEIVDTLPKTATGKIQRYKLRT